MPWLCVTHTFQKGVERKSPPIRLASSHYVRLANSPSCGSDRLLPAHSARTQAIAQGFQILLHVLIMLPKFALPILKKTIKGGYLTEVLEEFGLLNLMMCIVCICILRSL